MIERRTVQLFPADEIELALDRLAARPGERGVLVSHLNDCGGGPGHHRPHHANEWARSRGVTLDVGGGTETLASVPRLAYLRRSTG